MWYHMLSICVPDDIWYPDAGILAITGGSNPARYRTLTEWTAILNVFISLFKIDIFYFSPDPQYSVEQLICAAAAAESHAMFGYLRQIPDQRQIFTVSILYFINISKVVNRL